MKGLLPFILYGILAFSGGFYATTMVAGVFDVLFYEEPLEFIE